MFLRRAALLAALAWLSPISARAAPILTNTAPLMGAVPSDAAVGRAGSHSAACHSVVIWLVPESSPVRRPVARTGWDAIPGVRDEARLIAWDHLSHPLVCWILDLPHGDILPKQATHWGGAGPLPDGEPSIFPSLLDHHRATSSGSTKRSPNGRGNGSLSLGPKQAHASSESAGDVVPEHLLFAYLAAGGFVLLLLKRWGRRQPERAKRPGQLCDGKSCLR